jgi:uncharacterized protein (DUF488 family)
VLFERQKRLLALVDALGGEVGRLDFQKLLFLYCREEEEKPSYEFVPYHYGGFSFTSYDDRRRLEQQGLLEEEERSWKLTPEGRKAATLSPMVRVRIDGFVRRHAALRGDALVAEAYRRHPYYAIRSDIAERVLAGDKAALAAIAETRPSGHKPGVVTIGYQGRTLEAYLNKLLQSGVTVLCDVRRNAFSHKYGFSKSTLQKGCQGIGVRYEHSPELGIASEDRRKLETQADYNELFATYKRDTLPQQTTALERIRDWVNAGERVALTCFELLPHQCHRHCVADELERRWGDTLAPRHL